MPSLYETIPKYNAKDDTFKTSYGVAHTWKPGYYFPDSDTASKVNDTLQLNIDTTHQVNVSEHYKSMNKVMHDPKVMENELRSVYHPPPPHHWNVHYFNYFRDRYLASNIHRPLSPSRQKTEMQDQFKNIDGPSELWNPRPLKPFVLKDYRFDGPSKNIMPSTKNPALSGKVIYPKDKEVLRNLDPYLTTNMKEHRLWDSQEMEKLGRTDAATFWDLEDYPKAWGFGMKERPSYRKNLPREWPPMRNTMDFREPTDHHRMQNKADHVPHTGLKTLYQSSYTKSVNDNLTQEYVCPVKGPYEIPEPTHGLKYEVPKMYNTENSSYGKFETNVV